MSALLQGPAASLRVVGGSRVLQGWKVRPSASIATQVAIRFALVCGVLAVCTRHSTEYRLVLSSAAKNASAAGSAASAAARSSGTLIVAGPA